VDDTAVSLGFAVGAWLNDPAGIHAVRHALGLKIEGTNSSFPYLELSPNRPYSNYYIDFQDTTNNTAHEPFEFDGVSWIPIGWDQYNVTNGFGWNSQYYGVPNTIQTGNPILRCIDIGTGNELQSTICYDDYNHPDEFHFVLATGVYNITVAIGWEGLCRQDTEFVSINNVVLRNTTCSPCCQDSREYSAIVDVYPAANGGEIVMTFGNNLGYTILDYMKIETTSQSLPTITTITSSSITSTTGSSGRATSSGVSYRISVFQWITMLPLLIYLLSMYVR